MISIQFEDFDHATEYQHLKDFARSDGAIVTFTGIVRDFNDDDDVTGIELEYYPQMSQKALEQICDEAKQRWPLGAVRMADEQIVFVGVSSTHRKAAFESCQFIMDYLKKRVPLWKKEFTNDSSAWVASKASDDDSAKRWKE